MSLYLVIFRADANDYMVEVMNDRQLAGIEDRSQIVAEALIESGSIGQSSAGLYRRLSETLHLDEATPFRAFLCVMSSMAFDLGRNIQIHSQQHQERNN